MEVDVSLPDDAEGSVSDGPVGLHLGRTRHLAGRVAVGLRHRGPSAGAAPHGRGVAGCPGWGVGSSEARGGAEARGGSAAGGVHTEILVAQLGAREQVSTGGLPARAVEGHPSARRSPEAAPLGRLGGEETQRRARHDPVDS